MNSERREPKWRAARLCPRSETVSNSSFFVSFLKKLLTSELSAGLRETKTNEWHRHHIHHVVTTAASILAMSNEQVQFLPLQTDEAFVPSQHLISKARVVPL